MKKCQKEIKVKKGLLDIDYYINDELLVITKDKTLLLIKYDIGKIVKEYKSSIALYCICHSNDGKIFLGCSEGYVKVLNKVFQNITSLKIHDSNIVCLKLFKDGILCSTSWDRTFALSA